MIIPLPYLRNFSIKTAQIFVQQIIFIAAAKLIQCFGDLTDFRGDEISPYPAVFSGFTGLNGAVGIHVVTTLNEKLWLNLAHGFIYFHTAEAFIDAPALPCGISTPNETDVVALTNRGKMAGYRLAFNTGISQILKPDFNKNLAAFRQSDQILTGGKIARFQCVWATDNLRIIELLIKRIFHHHAGRTVGTTPHDCASRCRITKLDALFHQWNITRRQHIGD